ncbi:TetR/AcrR family transcriptional regulator [Streptomyces sp. NPDC059467]|uniref:TetR/AcrR family transcriptional regulator n=1 Tax=Streptomyces sp. NPDC059467 TaxID=3346844 RepID=UPI0036807DE4
MPRWNTDTRPRLVQAAVDLFTAQGYEATSVTEIAEAAGLTKPTFFRHFRDKREVLFAGQEQHAQIIADTVADAGADTTVLEAAACAVQTLAERFTEDRRDFNVRLAQVVAEAPDLQERAIYKRAALADALRDALAARGFGPARAGIAADLSIRAFYEAYSDWLTSTGEASMGELVTRNLTAARTGLNDLA